MEQTSSSSSSSGIDIHAALAILSARTPHEHHQHHQVNNNNSSSNGVGESDEVVPLELRQRGQIVNLLSSTTEDDDQQSSHPPSLPSTATEPNLSLSDNTKVQQQSSTATNKENMDEKGASSNVGKETQQQQQQRSNEIQSQLATMSIAQLVQMIFTAQEERVATYRTFEEGLTSIISTGNITAYPALCASITASFAVLSNTIISVRSVLLSTTSSTTNSQDVNQKELQQFINYTTQLQMHECTKLNLTAALHLEQLRLFSTSSSLSSLCNEVQKEEKEEESKTGERNNNKNNVTSSSSNNIGSNDGNSRGTIMRLLQESIHKLENDLSTNIIHINDVLEEMWCVASDILN